MKERLLQAYFIEGRDVGRPRPAGRPGRRRRARPSRGRRVPGLRRRRRRAARPSCATASSAAITAVPTFVFDGRVGRARRPGPRHDAAGAGDGGREARGRLRHSAALTARLSSSWTATLAARSVRTSTTRTPRPGGAARRRGRPTPVVGDAVDRGQRGEIDAVRRAEELLEAVARRSAAACGRNEKMPPPSLSTHDDGEVDVAAGRAEQAVACRAGRRRRRSAARSGRPVPRATPTAVDTTPSMPLAPRLATTRTPRAGPAEPLDVADRHRRRHHQRGAVGERRQQPRGRRPARSARRGRPATASMAVLGPAPRPAATGPATACRRRRSAASASSWQSVGRIGGDPHGGRVLGVDPRVGRRRPGPAWRPRRPATGPAPSTPAAARGAARPSGCGRRRTPGGAACRRRRRPSSAAAAGRPSGDRPAPATGRPPPAGAPPSGSPAPPPGDDHARAGRRGAAARASRASPPSSGDPAGAVVPRRPRRPRPAAAGRAHRRAGRGTGRLRWTGPGRRAGGVEHRPRRQRPPRGAHRVVGHAGVGEPAHRPAVEVALVDRLGRADVAQLGRPVGGAHEQRHLGLVGLDDGGVEVGRRGAAGGQQHRRAAAWPARGRGRRTTPSARRGGRARAARARPPAPAPAASSASRAPRRRR